MTIQYMKKQDYHITYDRGDDILNIWLSEEEIDSAKQTDDVRIHLTKEDKLVRIEILNAITFLQAQAKSLPKDVKEAVFA